MNPEFTICEECSLKKVCHPALSPEKLTRTGEIIQLNQDKSYADWQCRHAECPTGKEAAATALSSGELTTYQVVTLENETIEVKAVPFGTPQKPTHTDKLRIVAEDRKVYSLQQGIYYRVGSV